MESARTALGGGMQAAAEFAPPLAPAPAADRERAAAAGSGRRAAPGAGFGREAFEPPMPAAGTGRAEGTEASGDPAAEFLAQGPDGQRQVLVQLLRAGESDATIGARFRLSQWQVRNLRYRLGIRKDRGGNVHLAPRAGRGQPAEAAPSVALHIGGLFEAADLARRLLALGAMFESAPGTYRVRLQIEQPGAGA